ncbi:hypothetical protein IMCC26134_11610 [Verrucomicrobia bacterium IMCC26134]|nr:hypothetical protein IMCC26134_11610 [Verrucomicrobia bacterium IMCC26134]
MGAGFLALLYFTLNLLAFAPSAHAWLHQPTCSATLSDCSDSDAPSKRTPNPPARNEDGCAVTLIAQGIDGVPAGLSANEPARPAITESFCTNTDPLLSLQQHRLPASQAPPSIG